VDGELNFAQGGIELTFRNEGKAGAAFQVRFADGKTSPRTYTVAAGDEVSDVFGATGATSYDLSASGPNGFLRTFAGGLRSGSANLTVRATFDKDGEGVTLHIQNHGSIAEKVSILNAYSGKSQTRTVHTGHTATFESELHSSFGWYDLTVTAESDSNFARQLAGHLENGRPSMTDPAIGAH
jgi:phospholipase C